MAANYSDIEKALIKGYTDLALGYPTSYPAAELDPNNQPSDAPWIALHNLRAESLPATLGNQGEDNHPGLFQIDINTPKNKGSGQSLQIADTILGSFTSGNTLIYNAQEVKISSTSLSPGRYIGGFYRVSVTITYYARTTRN